MASNSIKINSDVNTVNIQPDNNRITVVNPDGCSVNVTQPITNVIQVATPGITGPIGLTGPSGSVGPSGSFDTSSFVTTSSFNSFTSSIQSEVNSLTSATSSYVSNSQTGSFTTTSSFNAFTGSINSFTSSIQSEVDNLTLQTGSYATTGSNNFVGNQVITGSLTVSGSSTFTNIGPAIFTGTSTFTNITASGNISASGNITGTTGSFSHLQGNSPITVGDHVTFQQPISASSLTSNNTSIFLGFDENNLNNNYIYIEDGGDLFILGYGGGVEIGSDDGYQINVKDTMEFTTPSQTSLILNDLYAVFQVPITTTNVTASGNISSSGTITGTTGSFNHIIGTVANVIWTIDFTDGELSTRLYAPYNLSIDSVTNITGSPTTSITSSGSPYTLGNAITIGTAIDVTSSISSVINLNITR
jgi:hypothetical protein